MSLLEASGAGAALFDIDATLVDYPTARRRGIADYVAGLGIEIDESVLLAEWLRLEDLHYGRFLAGEVDWTGQRRARLRGVLRWLDAAEPASDAEADAWFGDYWARCQAALVPYPDVEPCLAALDGLPYGIVTNNFEHVAGQKLAAAGLLGRFSVIVGVNQDLAAKPDPRIFRAGCAALGVAAEQTVYVGDQLDTDAVAARDAGMIGVWLDRSPAGDPGAGPAGLPPGVIRITSLAEL